MRACLACIGLGSNLGQPRQLLLEAWQALARRPGIAAEALSQPYRTRPVGMDTPHWFINAAGLLRTALPPEDLLDVLLETERQFGRVRFPERSGWQDRTLDLDLLLFDGCVLRTDRLILPHPALHGRMFVLAPLAEIAPRLRHPVLGKSIAKLRAELAPQAAEGDVERTDWAFSEPVCAGL